MGNGIDGLNSADPWYMAVMKAEIKKIISINNVEPRRENEGDVWSTTDCPGTGIPRRSQRQRRPNPGYMDYGM